MRMDNNPKVGLFFYICNRFLLFSCTLAEAERYGDFLIYPRGHMDVWDEILKKNYRVDYDYYPRGRIVYNTVRDSTIVYYDKCIEKDIDRIIRMLNVNRVQLEYDEHYLCHDCNPFYVI